METRAEAIREHATTPGSPPASPGKANAARVDFRLCNAAGPLPIPPKDKLEQLRTSEKVPPP